MSLRLLQESDLELVLEAQSDWGMPVILKGPSGATQEVNGQVLNSYYRFNPESGETEIVQKPVVTLRISSLSPVPNHSEIWSFQIPTTPDPASAKTLFVFDTSKAPEFVRDFGLVKYRLTQATQSAP